MAQDMRALRTRRPIWVALILAGCSGGASSANPGANEPDGSSSGSSGGSDAAGSTDDGGGSADDASATDATSPGSFASDRAACRAYVVAECNRIGDCNGQAALGSCLAIADQCPDYFLSPGTSWTRATLASCAIAWKTWACEKTGIGVPPPCSPAGSRAVGAACSFSSQCASRDCSVDGKACGQCLDLVAPGGDCSVNKQCSLGQTCSSTTYNCTDRVWMPPDAGALQVKGLNQPCAPTDVCAAGSECLFQKDFLDGTGVCRALPKAGETCGIDRNDNGACVAGAYCYSLDNTCRPQAVAGEPCDNISGNWYCADGCVCDLSTKVAGNYVCQAIHEEGEPCGTANVQCANTGLVCQGGVCTATDQETVFASFCEAD